MKRLVRLLSLAAMLCAGSANAASVSQATLLFLKIAPGARAAGMGETFVAIADNADATWWNPAGLGFVRDHEITMMYVRWLPQFNLSDLYYAFLSGVYNLSGNESDPEGLGTIGGNIIFLNLGETQRTNVTGAVEGTFSSYEIAATGAYGAEILRHELSLGVALKLAYSHLTDRGAGSEAGSGTATAVAVDVGVLYKTRFLRGLSFGANLSNMGPKVAYIDRAQADPLPTTLKVGFAYKILDLDYNRLTIASDVSKELVRRDAKGRSDEFYEALFTAWGDGDLIKSLIWNVGAEYWYGNLVGLRAGYWNDHLGKVFPYTFGLSLKLKGYRFDFSYLTAGQNHPLTNTMRYSLSIAF